MFFNFLSLCLICSLLFSCTKDGKLSLRSRTQRISNSWKINQYQFDTNEIPSQQLFNCALEIKKNGDVRLTVLSDVNSTTLRSEVWEGEWTFESNDDRIEFVFDEELPAELISLLGSWEINQLDENFVELERSRLNILIQLEPL